MHVELTPVSLWQSVCKRLSFSPTNHVSTVYPIKNINTSSNLENVSCIYFNWFSFSLPVPLIYTCEHEARGIEGFIHKIPHIN